MGIANWFVVSVTNRWWMASPTGPRAEVGFVAAEIYGIRSIVVFMTLKSASSPSRTVALPGAFPWANAFPCFYGWEMNILIWSPPTERSAFGALWAISCPIHPDCACPSWWWSYVRRSFQNVRFLGKGCWRAKYYLQKRSNLHMFNLNMLYFKWVSKGLLIFVSSLCFNDMAQ